MQCLLQWKSKKHYVYWVCVCNIWYPACGAHHSIICGLSGCTVHFHIHKTACILEKKGFGHKICVLFFFATFLILRRTEQDVIKMYIAVHVRNPLILSYIKETWIVLTDFQKILKYYIWWGTIWWEPSCSTRTVRWTDRRDKVNSRFSEICKFT